MGLDQNMAELRIRDLEQDLHKALRHLAVERGISLNALVKELLRQAMEKIDKVREVANGRLPCHLGGRRAEPP